MPSLDQLPKDALLFSEKPFLLARPLLPDELNKEYLLSTQFDVGFCRTCPIPILYVPVLILALQ
jgi:hypothetical protein